MNWYLEALKKYAVFEGRARRKEYGYFTLFNVLIGIGLYGLMVIGSMDISSIAAVGAALGFFLYNVATLIPSIAVTVRRLHDIGHSGWWLLIALIPFIGGIALIIVLLVEDSQSAQNQYGPNPKAATATA